MEIALGRQQGKYSTHGREDGIRTNQLTRAAGFILEGSKLHQVERKRTKRPCGKYYYCTVLHLM